MGRWLALACAAQVLSSAAALAQGGSLAAWKACQSSEAEERLRGCTAVIDAGGFGSLSKLADALDGRCWAYHVKKQFTRAIGDCRASIRMRPRNPYAYNNLGTAYAGLGDYQNAIAAFNTAVELKPDFFWSRYNRANAFAAFGDMESAKSDYEYLLIQNPHDADVRDRLKALRWDKKTVPAEFRGYYQAAYENADGLKCTQKDWGKRDGGLLIATTKVEGKADEGWDCDISNMSLLDPKYPFDADYNNEIIVDQVCSGEGGTQPIREIWSIKKADQMILLIQTDSTTLKSTVWIRCRGR
jgi:tetratricopeptide (TPR) repeat protein